MNDWLEAVIRHFVGKIATASGSQLIAYAHRKGNNETVFCVKISPLKLFAIRF